MRRTLKLFAIPAGKPPGSPPEPGTVEAATEDGLRGAAGALVAERGQRLRSLSFTPTGLVAYVEAQ